MKHLELYNLIFLLLIFSNLPAEAKDSAYTPVITPNGTTMPWTMEDGYKVFRIEVNECEHEISPGMSIKAWCYNGRTPGPTIEAVEGDKVRMLVTNKLPESTAIHWHGIFLPNGMDGVSGLNQKPIRPGETFLYEFVLKQNGTFMYHSHADEMIQMGLGTMGMFIIHPRTPESPKIDKDFVIMLSEWYVEPGTERPNPNVMTDFNVFTFNSKAFPGTDSLMVKKGDRVRIRFGNVAQESHPIHLHGYNFKVVETDGGKIPLSAQWPETTVSVFPGQTRTIEFVADALGDWAMHCHRRHHPMNAMGHTNTNVIGVDQSKVESKVAELLPNTMLMGSTGMDEMLEMQMPGPPNTLPMMGGDGPFGPVGMGGMFTIVKVRESLEDKDIEWYQHPPGTVAHVIEQAVEKDKTASKTEVKNNTENSEKTPMKMDHSHHHME